MMQPWASMRISDLKRIETRTWATKYRGPVLVCSSQQPDREALLKFPHDSLTYGHALGIFTLDDCRPMTPEDERLACYPCTPGRFAWTSLTPASRLKKSFFIKGRLGLFKLRDFELAELERAIA